VFFALAGSSHAAVLATAPARSGYPAGSGRTLYCDIRNLNTGNGIVTIDLLDYPGNVIATSGPVTVGPNESYAQSDFGSGDGVSCRFTVSGSPKKWRGVAMYDNGTDYTVSIPAQ